MIEILILFGSIALINTILLGLILFKGKFINRVKVYGKDWRGKFNGVNNTHDYYDVGFKRVHISLQSTLYLGIIFWALFGLSLLLYLNIPLHD